MKQLCSNPIKSVLSLMLILLFVSIAIPLQGSNIAAQELQPTPTEAQAAIAPADVPAVIETQVTAPPTETPIVLETQITATETPSAPLSETPANPPIPLDRTARPAAQQPDNNILYPETNSLLLVGEAQAKTIVDGGSHTCALTTVGGVKCWGWNVAGQLGNSSTTDSRVPVNVYGYTAGIQAIAAGGAYTCTLTTNGAVQCWGYNNNGQLGNNSNTESHVPVNVYGLTSGVQAITAGGGHTCALATNGGVKCWGYNSDGQLGNNSTTESHVLVNVNGLTSGVQSIAAGASHTCALTIGGKVKCWGANWYGQLGNNATTDSLVPVDVYGLSSSVQAIAAGYWHTCALMTGGGVKCWGWNQYGQLGNNATTNSSIPVNIYGLASGVQAIAGGGHHTCALTTVSGVKCWGDNHYGQLGINSTTEQHVPVSVYGLTSGVKTIAAGGSHTCALTTGGVKCWGQNYYGQLGNNATTDSYLPVAVYGFPLDPVTMISPRGTISNPNPTYTWTADLDATAYDLYSDNNMAQILTATEANCIDGTGNCSSTPASNLKAGIHTWNIIARNDMGSSTSAVQTFIQTSPLYGFDLQFNANMSGVLAAQGTWAVNSTSLYSNTLVAITGPVPGHHYQGSLYYNANFSTLDYQVKVMRSGCDTCATKMYVRGDGIPVFAGWKNGYQFNIKRSGYYYVGKTVNGTLIPLKDWTRSTAIKTASNWNLLRVTAKGSSLKFYINNVLVWSKTDTSRSTGRVGVGLYSNGTGGVNRLYMDYATLTTTVVGAAPALDLNPAESVESGKSDPNGGNW